MTGLCPPRVSVIMAVYNCEDYVREAIESVRAQTFADWELICVDDCSTDRSPEIVGECAARDERIVLLENPCNMGAPGARNVALEHARGEFVAVLDSDDKAPPDRFDISLSAFAQETNLGLIGGQHAVIGPAGEVHEQVAREPLDDRQFKAELMNQRMPVPHSSCMIRRELLVAIGGYDERLPSSQDYDMALRVSPLCRCARLGELLLQYRHRPGQITEQNTFAQALYCQFALHRARARAEGRSFDEEAALQRIEQRISGRHGFSRPASLQLRGLALRAIQSGDHRRFRQLIGRSLGYWPFSMKTLICASTTLMPASVRTKCANLWSRL